MRQVRRVEQGRGARAFDSAAVVVISTAGVEGHHGSVFTTGAAETLPRTAETAAAGGFGGFLAHFFFRVSSAELNLLNMGVTVVEDGTGVRRKNYRTNAIKIQEGKGNTLRTF